MHEDDFLEAAYEERWAGDGYDGYEEEPEDEDDYSDPDDDYDYEEENDYESL